MEIEFDPRKNARNIERRGLPLAEARVLFTSPTLEREDRWKDYGERRMVAIGRVADEVLVCVYTLRAGKRRIISLRKANGREANAYHASSSRQPD